MGLGELEGDWDVVKSVKSGWENGVGCEGTGSVGFGNRVNGKEDVGFGKE